MNSKDISKIVELVIQQIGASEQQPAIQKPPAHKMEDIPAIIKKMSIDEIKHYFGTEIGISKTNPYKALQKKFFETYNIQSDTKYKPRLTLEHKHLIIQKLMQSVSKKQQQEIKNNCIKYLQERIKNPPATLYGKPATKKQQEYIINSYKEELSRWIKKPTK